MLNSVENMPSVALCELGIRERGWKSRPAAFPGRMSWKATKPVSVCPVSQPRFLCLAP